MNLEHTFEPWCSRRLTATELDELLNPLLIILDQIKTNEELASSVRALLRHASEGKSIWLTTEPPTHRDFSRGTAVLQIVEAGRVIATLRLFSA